MGGGGKNLIGEGLKRAVSRSQSYKEGKTSMDRHPSLRKSFYYDTSGYKPIFVFVNDRFIIMMRNSAICTYLFLLSDGISDIPSFFFLKISSYFI